MSLTNSVDVAQRLADYYARRETIQVDVNPQAGPPGAVVQIYHPWDKVLVEAAIQERETTISGLLKARTEALVGWKPQQPDIAEYLDERVVLTGSGTWTLPEGAQTLRAVLIGAGADGTAGTDGGDNFAAGKTTQNTTSSSFAASSAGAGGQGGQGGSGGKVLIVTLETEAGQSFTYDTAGSEVTFGSHSSAQGTASESGYYDSVTQQTFARKGADGYAGGQGGSAGQDGESVADYAGGAGNQSLPLEYSDGTYTARASAQGFGGGGAAYGSSGNAANGYLTWQGYPPNPNVSVKTKANGANAINASDGVNYGDGGGGGHGGGGAGATGSVSVSFSPAPPASYQWSYSCGWSGVWLDGGKGSAGGKGQPGCIILYYRKPKPVQAGPLVTADGKSLLDSLGRRMIV